MIKLRTAHSVIYDNKTTEREGKYWEIFIDEGCPLAVTFSRKVVPLKTPDLFKKAGL